MRIPQINASRDFLLSLFDPQISPPVVQQFGQFVISVKNNKKIDAEKIKKFEFQVGRVLAEFL